MIWSLQLQKERSTFELCQTQARNASECTSSSHLAESVAHSVPGSAFPVGELKVRAAISNC